MKKLFTLFLLMACYVSSFAEFKPEISKDKLKVNEKLTLHIKFKNENKEKYEVEGMAEFDIITKGSNSTYHSLNGKVRSEDEDFYVLSPKKNGTFKLNINTESGKKASFSINVSTIEEKKEEELNKKEIEDIKISLESNLNKKEAYVGENLIFSQNLISDSDVERFAYKNSDSFKDFNITNFPRSYRGKDSKNINLFNAIISAKSSGTKIISGGEVEVRFEDRLNTSFRKANNIEVNIKDLPKDAPANFKNTVGELKGGYYYSGDNINLGDFVNLNIKLYGNVNLEGLKKIFPDIEGFKVYEKIISYEEDIRTSDYYSTKEFRISFVPEKTGLLTIPKLEIPYFNVKTEGYDKFVINEHSIIVNDNNK